MVTIPSLSKKNPPRNAERLLDMVIAERRAKRTMPVVLSVAENWLLFHVDWSACLPSGVTTIYSLTEHGEALTAVALDLVAILSLDIPPADRATVLANWEDRLYSEAISESVAQSLITFGEAAILCYRCAREAYEWITA